MSKIMYGGIAYGSAVDEDYGWTDLIGTLPAGETTLTIQHEVITPDVAIAPHSDPYGVNPTDMVVTNGQVVLTFNAQPNDVRIMVRVSKTNIGSMSLKLKYQDDTIGSTTYTIDSDGIYLIFVVFSLGGSGSITLPSGRTASYTGDFLTTGAAQGDKGTRIVVASLQKDDVITLSASPAVDRPDHQTWNAFAKIVMKIPFSVTTLLDSRIISDNSVTYEYHTGSGTVLGILTAWSAFLDQSTLFDLSELGTVDDVIAGRTGVNTMIRVVISDIATLPKFFARGYNGGGVTIAVLQ